MKKILINFIFLCGILNTGFSQETELKEVFLTAESYFLFEEFNEALPLYLKIHRQMPDNDNVNFKIGVCYLNDPFQKDKSIGYLEKASKNISPKYKENNFKELAAPPDVLFYLGNAYRVNNDLNKAIETYQLFKSNVDTSIYDIQLVEDQITACKNADQLFKKPVDIEVENLGSTINTRFSDQNPVISGDERKMVFVSRLQFYDAVFYAEKVNGKWTTPRNIVPELGVDGDVYPTGLSYDGKEMIIYRNDEFIGNLYSSKQVNGKWTPIVKLNENINTRFWESHGSLSRDGKTLYFSSNRKGGYGGLDIYRSERTEGGDWGIPENLGPVINSKYNDDTPFITPSGKKLFFSSYGHFNIGGYDLLMSKKQKDGTWAEPSNLGYPINTTDDDQFLVPLEDGEIAYYSVFDPGDGFGRTDIMRYRIFTADHPRLYPVSGTVGYLGSAPDPSDVSISILRSGSTDTLTTLKPGNDGFFRFEVPAGKYDMVFESDKYKKKIVPLEITPDTPHEGIVLKDQIALELQPPSVSPDELDKMLTIREDSIIYATEGEEVKIRYNAERGSEVVIDVFHNGEQISSDTTIADRRRLSYDFIAQPGETEIRITVTDNDGNSITKNVKVIVPVEITTRSEEESVAGGMESAAADKTSDISASDDIEALTGAIQKIHENAVPALQEYLDKIDLEALGIKTLNELIDHLYDAAETEEFTHSQVNEALSSAGLISDLDAYIRDLATVSSPKLKEYLLSLDPEKEGIDNENDLVRHLYENAGEDTYSVKDVTDAINRLNDANKIKELIEELKPFAQGALLDYLENLDPLGNNLFTLDELQKHLLDNAEENGYTKEEVIKMFQDYFDSEKQSMKEVLEKMIEKSEGDILDFLESVHNIWNDSLENRKKFYDTLFEGTQKQNLDQEKIISLALDAEDISRHNLVDHFTKYGDFKLKEVVTSIPVDIFTPEGIYDYLLSDKSLNSEKITELAKEYLYNRDLYDTYYSLKRNSDGALKNYLESLDIRNSGFSTPQDLIDHLLKVSADNGFSEEDVYRALGNSFNESWVNKVISDLISLSGENIRKALLALDPLKENIRSLGDIVDYLLKYKDLYGYSEQEVFDLVMNYLYGDKEEILMEEETGTAGAMASGFNRGVMLTAGILLLEGLIIIVLIILARRKRKKEMMKS